MLRISKTFLLLLPFLLLSACFEDDDTHPQAMMGGAPYAMMESSMDSAAPSMGGRAMMKSAPSPQRANMAIDRSKLGNKRIAESHRLEVEIEQALIRARQQADFNRCLQMKCEILDSQSGKNYGHLSVRIVPEELTIYLKALEEGKGEIVGHNVSVDDRTMAYIDTEAQLKTKNALHARLTKLLESDAVKNVSELLRVERELSRVQREIDSATGQMRHLQNETAKVRVNVSYSVPTYARIIEYKELKASFYNAWRGLIRSTSQVVEFTGRSLPWIPVLLIGLWLFVRALKMGFGSVGFSFCKKKPLK